MVFPCDGFEVNAKRGHHVSDISIQAKYHSFQPDRREVQSAPSSIDLEPDLAMQSDLQSLLSVPAGNAYLGELSAVPLILMIVKGQRGFPAGIS